MIYSTEEAPRVEKQWDVLGLDRLYTLKDNGNGLEYVVFRTPIPGVVGPTEVQLYAPQDGLAWHFDGVSDPNVTIYDDIVDGFKLVFEQGTPA